MYQTGPYSEPNGLCSLLTVSGVHDQKNHPSCMIKRIISIYRSTLLHMQQCGPINRNGICKLVLKGKGRLYYQVKPSENNLQ